MLHEVLRLVGQHLELCGFGVLLEFLQLHFNVFHCVGRIGGHGLAVAVGSVCMKEEQGRAA